MKINEPSADVDTSDWRAFVRRSMCVGPEYVSRDEFFDIASARLRNNPGVSDLSVIPDAFAFAFSLMARFVPIITMKYGGIEFDLSYAPIARYPSRLPLVCPIRLLHSQDFDILDDNNLKNVDEKTVRSLNGRRVTDTILKCVPNKTARLPAHLHP